MSRQFLATDSIALKAQAVDSATLTSRRPAWAPPHAPLVTTSVHPSHENARERFLRRFCRVDDLSVMSGGGSTPMGGETGAATSSVGAEKDASGYDALRSTREQKRRRLQVTLMEGLQRALSPFKLNI